jgi:hypothetical protein
MWQLVPIFCKKNFVPYALPSFEWQVAKFCQQRNIGILHIVIPKVAEMDVFTHFSMSPYLKLKLTIFHLSKDLDLP